MIRRQLGGFIYGLVIGFGTMVGLNLFSKVSEALKNHDTN